MAQQLWKSWVANRTSRELSRIANIFVQLKASNLLEKTSKFVFFKTIQKTSKILSKKVSLNIDFILQNLENSSKR